MLLFSQLITLLWKEKVQLRANLPSLLSIILVPSLLVFIASTQSSASTSSSSLGLKECTIDSFLYCNYPMIVDASFTEFGDDVNSTKTTFELAALSVAEELGVDASTFFSPPNNTVEMPYKIGASVTITSPVEAEAVWYFGENTLFAQKFVDLFNEELIKVNNTIRFKEVENPFAYEADDNAAFDLRFGSFLLLLQIVGGNIAHEKETNMFFYLTRAGMLPSAFWIFQYIFWMIIASLTIGVTAIAGEIFNSPIQVGAYFVSAWFHVAIAVFLGSILKNKKFINLSSFFFLIVGFAVPIIFASLEQTELSQRIFDGFSYIPVFFMRGNITSHQLKVGSIISAGLTVLAAYLAPLFTVSDGMYAGAKVNPFYFLTSKFWKEGIVALPSHQEDPLTLRPTNDNGGFDLNGEPEDGLVFLDCVKRFGEDKIIGPMNLTLKAGSITTLLGPNGVGKSTLMRVAAGYYIPSAGEMILEGSNTFRERPWSSLKSISFCPQDNYIYEDMTVEEHMLLIASFRDMSRIDGGDILSHIIWILDTLDIVQKKTTLAKNLSGGMKRRLCLAMSTVGFPKILLCDEPSSGVDSVSQRGIWKILEVVKQKSAILLASHSSLEAVILSDSVVWMKTSEDIIQNNGIQSMAFSLKNVEENTTTEYEVNLNNVHEIKDIVSALPNDGSEWKITSKRLTEEELPPLENILKDDSEHDSGEAAESQQVLDGIPETAECGTPSTFRQIWILMSLMTMHVDRLFFVIVFGLPLNGAQIWLAYSFAQWDDMAHLILTPLMPMISFIVPSIFAVQIVDILAQERSIGVSKLFFSTGITRFAYLSSYIIFFTLFSFPFTIAMLISTGSVYGTSGGMVALFFIYLSFFFLLLGICAALGAILDPKTAFVMTLILPSLFSFFGQGTTSETFANTYPGSIGQVMASLAIDNMDNTGMYIMSFALNFIIGCATFYVFMVTLGNYNPLANLCRKNEMHDVVDDKELADIENYVRNDDNIFLEGRSVVKSYSIGQKDTMSFRALDDVTFSVTKGSLLGLVGKSGAGKSTLMDILAGQLNVTTGNVYVEGVRVFPSTISKVVSICGQFDTIWPTINVDNAIKIFMRCRGYKKVGLCSSISDPYVKYLINELGMEDMMKKKVKELSGGQKRRLTFLVSLLGNTKVVLVDEAMTGVDVDTRKVMWKILQDEVRLRDRSVVVTSHEMTEIEQYCNTVGILHDGKLVEMGKLDDIKKKWSDSIKLICLFSDISSVSQIEKLIIESQPEIVVGPNPHIDVLDEPIQTRIVATYAINLVNLENIAGLVRTMNMASSDNSSLLFWSIGPQSLDDFVRSKSNSTIV